MSWDDDELRGRRDAVLARVRSRAAQLRRRRRFGKACGAVGIVALVAFPAVAVLVDEGGSSTVRVVSPAPGDQPGASTSIAEGTSSATRPPSITVAAPTTTEVPDGVVSTTAFVPDTVAPPSPTTSLPSPGLPNGVPTPTTTTTAEPDHFPCRPSLFQGELVMEKSTYGPGEAVRFTATFTNVSGRPCTHASVTTTEMVLGLDGEPTAPPLVTVADYFRIVPFAAGEAQSHQGAWDQQVCGDATCAPAPAGTYTAVVEMSPFGQASATFVLTG